MTTFARLAFVALASALTVGCGCGGHGSGPSSAASLLALVPSAGSLSPSFSESTTAYSVGPVTDDTVAVTATTTHPLATLTVNGTPVASGTPSPAIPLAVGLNPVTVVVTAEDGATTATYTVVFERVDTPPAISVQDAYVKASNTEASDVLGYTIAISGDTMVVGAADEDSAATGVDGNQADNSAAESGAAYVFVRTAGVWSQQAYLKASNTGAGDAFGTYVAVSGDTVVVGAPAEDGASTGTAGDPSSNAAANAGAAYVFVRTGTTWSQQAYLKASNTDAGDRFGTSVAISGDTIVVGAQNEQSAATGVGGNEADDSRSLAGAAYVFVRAGTAWSQQAYLKGASADFDLLGRSVAISGDTVVVGAEGDDGAVTDSGAAYVFVRSGAAWSAQATLKASNPGNGDSFGFSVAVSGDTVVVGAQGEDSPSTGVNPDPGTDPGLGFDAGAAYVFVRSGTSWTQEAYLKASNSGQFDGLGSSVAISANTIVVGAYGERSAATGVNGLESDNSLPGAGAAYVFSRSGATWTQDAYLKASNTESDLFGSAVAVAGGTVAVGAIRESSNAVGIDGDQADNTALGSGAVYVFR